MNRDTTADYLRTIGKLKLEPLKQWHCDKCREVIDSAEDGWLEWLKKIDNDKEYKFRIVHHSKKCMYDARTMYNNGFLIKDMPLEHFVGPDGLNHLLDIMLRPHVDQNEVAEIIKRLHIPYYEESLLCREQALSDAYISGNLSNYCNVEENLSLIRHYTDEE